jgi:hypothetical protein
VFYSSDGSNVVVIEPKQTKSNLPRPEVDTNVKVLNSPACPPGQVTVIQRNQDNPVCLNRGDSANVVEVLAIRNRTVAYTIFNDSRIYPGETRTFTSFPGGTVMVEQ